MHITEFVADLIEDGLGLIKDTCGGAVESLYQVWWIII